MVLVAGLFVAACSRDSGISEADHALATQAVSLSASLAGIELTAPDRVCVVDRLSAQEATELGTLYEGNDGVLALTDDLSSSVADAVVACVGTDTMIRSGMLAFAGDVSDESLACTGDRFDRQLLGELISSLMEGKGQMSTEIEIEINLVLGVCLSPTELLRLHQN